jgi:hypothetical protein
MKIRPIEMPKQKKIASFSKMNALKLAKKLKKYRLSEMVLYGGGSFGQQWIVYFKDVYPLPWFNYDTEEYMTNEWAVKVNLEILEGEPIIGKKEFSPNLGSWKLAEIIKEKSNPKVKSNPLVEYYKIKNPLQKFPKKHSKHFKKKTELEFLEIRPLKSKYKNLMTKYRKLGWSMVAISDYGKGRVKALLVRGR